MMSGVRLLAQSQSKTSFWRSPRAYSFSGWNRMLSCQMSRKCGDTLPGIGEPCSMMCPRTQGKNTGLPSTKTGVITVQSAECDPYT